MSLPESNPSSRRPRLLDLFCGAGGAAMGYHRAGFDVVGVDIRPQPNYPFEFVQDDALEVLGEVGCYVSEYAVIHASPPCQRYIRGGLQGDDHPDLLGQTRDLLEQTLRNLGENAAKHTARGSISLRARSDGSTVTVEVEDSGPGISPEVQRHVFDRFYRGERDAHGFGLGLAIVRESVRTLGARIELDSSPGQGTVFRILLAPARVREEVPAA